MYTGEDIKQRRESISNNILKGFSDSDLEKAHNQGDVHPNGKWYWESSAAGGKGDWRVIGGKRHKQSASSAPKKEEKEPAKKEEKKTQIMGKVDTFEDLLKIAPKKYHDYLKRANNEYEKEKKKFVKDFEEEAEESTPQQMERAKKNFEDFTQSVPDYGTDKYYYVGLKEMVRDAESGRYDVDKLLGESHMKEIARKNAVAAARRTVLSSKKSIKGSLPTTRKGDADMLEGTDEQFNNLYEKIKDKKITAENGKTYYVAGLTVRKDGYTEAVLRYKPGVFVGSPIGEVLSGNVENIFGGGSGYKPGIHIEKK